MTQYRRLTACLFVAVVATTGCQHSVETVDPQLIAQARSQFVLDDEPAGVEGVLDVQETFESPRSVVLVGKIGGVENPWSQGRASFVIADPVVLAEATDDTEAEHECSDAGCKFCARKAAEKAREGLAFVQFVDESGQVVPIDARKLFDLQEEQTVVVVGHAEMDGLGCLIVSADGLYVRRS